MNEITYCPPMLASDIKDRLDVINAVIKKPYDWVYEMKIDGVRMLTTIEHNNLIVYSRNGLVYPNVAEYLEQQFKNLDIFKNYVIDGEVYDTNVRRTMSRISNQQQKVEKLYYYIFDVFPKQNCTSICTIPLIKRKQILKDLLLKSQRSGYMIYVPYKRLRISNPDKMKDEIFDIANKYVDNGWEGIVLKHSKSPYIHTRSKLWWKVKKFYTLDLRCIGVVESKAIPGTLGGIIVDVCGVPTIVGNGFTNKERVMFWKDKTLIVGKIVEVKYFEKLPTGKLRFATFIRIRNDKTEPDC